MRCFYLQNECEPHYRTTDSVLTIISQHIWIKIGIVLGIIIIFEKFRTGMSCIWICMSSQQIDDFRLLNSGSVTGWGGWSAVQRWSRLWSPHSASGAGWCTCSFASPACLRIVCSAIWPKEGSRTFRYDEVLLGVFVSQPSPFYAQETQYTTSFLLGPWRVVSYCNISFALLQRTKSLLWPFWPYSMPGSCRTVPAVPDLLAMP